MPTMRTRGKCSIPVTNPNPTVGGTSVVSIYEKCRQDRIKENLQRMQNLGILDLSLKLKSETRPVKRQYRKANSDPDRDSTPPLQLSVSTRRSSRLKKETPVARRSSRLKNATPVTYFEGAEEKKGKACKEEIVWLGEGERPEIYTDEHEKLLGNTERAWELFVDGYDKDGKRIYDPVTGKSCHQCRQKTLGYRTQCSRCHPSVAGQFCGDCLYMRYGEHVLEALENPDWICPRCRGICNCSFCRKHKGWLPTGAAYRKICKLGYKSVAHYLIQTNKQSETSDDGETDDERSLSLKEAKVSSEEDDGLEDDGIDDNLDDEEEGANKNPDSARENQTSMIDDVVVVGDVKPLDVNEMDPATPVIIDVEDYYTKKEKKGETSRSKRKFSVEPNPNSIGGRLRQRRKCQAS
uniref:Cell division cycle-associated 7-like protein n=1 Tax=Noccaea caerulescens TaxID=107243 RepID=A0A1J3FBU3_NOCCA